MQEFHISNLKGMEKRYEELNKLLSDPHVLENRQLLEAYGKEHGELEKTVSLWQKYKRTEKERKKLEEIWLDEEEEEMRELVEKEKKELSASQRI